jgi:putative peptidoglycan lipid II flippase
LNISIIVFAILFGEGIKGLACGVLVGGLLQLTVQIPLLYKKGMRLKLFRRFRHPGAKAIAVLMLPRLFSSCIYQLNNFVDSIFGSLAVVVGEGGVAVLYFAYRLIHFPLGVFSNALSQAILPTFSSQVLEERKERLKESLSFGLRGVFFVILPASAIFISSSRLLVDSLFGGGRFDDYSIEKTSAALFFYSIGLFAYAAAKMMQSCFFALKDTLTPAKVSALALGLNILFNILLMFPLGIGGIALATSISGIITALILFSLLKRRLAPFPLAPIAGSFLRILLASIFMGVVCCFVSRRGLFFSGHTLWRLCALSLHLALGAVTYIIFSLVFRVREMQELWRWAVKRKTPTRRL